MKSQRVVIDPPWYEKGLVVLILAIPLGGMVYAAWPTLSGGGFSYPRDAGGHLFRAVYWVRSVLPSGHFFGWFPQWYGGIDLYHTYPVLLYWIMGPLSLVFEQQWTLRLVSFLLWIGILPASYLFLKSFGFSSPQAALGASLSSLLNSTLSFGPDAIYDIGLLPIALGFILVIVMLGLFKKILHAEIVEWKSLFVGGAVWGCLILSHPFCAYWGFFISFILLLTERFNPRSEWKALFFRYAVMILIGLGLSSPWWLGFLLNMPHMLSTNPFGVPEFNDILWRLTDLKSHDGLIVTLMAGVGFVALVRKRDWSSLIFLGGVLTFSFLLSFGAANKFLPFGGHIGWGQRGRFQGFLTFFILMGAAQAFRFFSFPHTSRPLLFWFMKVRDAGLVVLLGFFLLIPLKEARGRIHSTISTRATSRFPGLIGFLDQRVRPGEFVLSEDELSDYSMYGTPHFLHQNLPLASPRLFDWSGGYPEGSIGTSWSKSVSANLASHCQKPAFERELLKRGIRYVVCLQGTSIEALRRSSWLGLVWKSSPNEKGDDLAVFEVKGFRHRFGLSPEIDSNMREFHYRSPGSYDISFNKPVDLPPGASVALNYHPWFSATANGKPVLLRRGSDNVTELSEGASGVSSLVLTFSPPWFLTLLGWVSFAGFLTFIIYELIRNVKSFLHERIKRI